MKIYPKIFQIVLVSLIAILIFSIGTDIDVVLSQDVIRIPDDVSGPPYVLDQAGKTYILTQDISAPGTAIIINADGITLDLNRHTITYGNLDGDYRYGVAVPPSYARPEFPDITPGGGNNIVIKNGVINEGAGSGSFRHAIAMWGTSGTEVTEISGRVYGTDTSFIKTDYSSNLKIYHNNLTNDVTNCTNRHALYTTTIKIEGGNNNRVYDNTVRGGLNAIFINGGSGHSIHNNDVSSHSINENPYAIHVYRPDGNVEIYNNYIHPDGSWGLRGIMNNGGDGVLIHDNIVEVRMPTSTPIGGDAVGIRVRYDTYGTKVYNNQITVEAGGDYLGGYGLWVSDTQPYMGNEYYNNTINIIAYSNNVRGLGIAAECEGEVISDTVFYSNTITSDRVNLALGEFNGGVKGFLFKSNTFIKGSNPINYNTFYIGYYKFNVEDINLLDSKFKNGASYNSIAFTGATGGGNYNFYVKWYLDFIVKDDSGTPMSGATVTAISSEETVSAITNTEGRARLELTEYNRYGSTLGTSNFVYYTPHTLTVTKDGYETSTQEITMDASKLLTVTLVPTVVNSPPFANDLSMVKAYPNPYRGDKHSQITFNNLTANVKIRIYSLTGELVKEISEQEGDKAYWDVKNKQGEAVASGIYIYYITNPKGQEKKGKLAIIR